MQRTIAIIGGGPAGLFVLMKLLDSRIKNLSITIFEASAHAGCGMPFDERGANWEHITNVSGNEIPPIRTSLQDWIQHYKREADKSLRVLLDEITEYNVVPRLLFGRYLQYQFRLLQLEAEQAQIPLTVLVNTTVVDIKDRPQENFTSIETQNGQIFEFSKVIICTGHVWPKKNEGHYLNYFDSPYPPSKLRAKINCPVAITGSSLTAIDALETLAHSNGRFIKVHDKLRFELMEHAEKFRIVMYSKNGLLPSIRFNLNDPRLSTKGLLSKESLIKHKDENEGFISLDYVFEQDFKEQLRRNDLEFYVGIKDMSLETFVTTMLGMREQSDAFQLFKSEYQEAKASIQKRESIYWKEKLAILSFAMNYPAKYFSAEDMLRLQKVLHPLIAIVIAFVPQHSCDEIMAMQEAGKLEIVVTDESGEVSIRENGINYHYVDRSGNIHNDLYQYYIDCSGQQQLSIDDFPFKSMVKEGLVKPAAVRFKNVVKRRAEQRKNSDKVGDLFLKVPGIAINDFFQIVGSDDIANERIYIMAVPFIGGFNPDYSGLDFCDETADVIVKHISSSSTD